MPSRPALLLFGLPCLPPSLAVLTLVSSRLLTDAISSLRLSYSFLPCPVHPSPPSCAAALPPGAIIGPNGEILDEANLPPGTTIISAVPATPSSGPTTVAPDGDPLPLGWICAFDAGNNAFYFSECMGEGQQEQGHARKGYKGGGQIHLSITISLPFPSLPLQSLPRTCPNGRSLRSPLQQQGALPKLAVLCCVCPQRSQAAEGVRHWVSPRRWEGRSTRSKSGGMLVCRQEEDMSQRE